MIRRGPFKLEWSGPYFLFSEFSESLSKMGLVNISSRIVHSSRPAPVRAKPLPEPEKAAEVDEVVLSEAANPQVGSFRPNHTDVYKSALRLCAAMAALNIPCAVAGGLAVTAHGYQRSTPDVDVIMTPEGLEKFQDWGNGRGWVPRYEGSRNMRDNSNDVGVDIILTTDGPVDVPSPTATVENPDGLPVLALPELIELKLSTAQLNSKRKKDIRDVTGLIKKNRLGPEYAELLDESVRGKFLEICEGIEPYKSSLFGF